MNLQPHIPTYFCGFIRAHVKQIWIIIGTEYDDGIVFQACFTLCGSGRSYMDPVQYISSHQRCD